ncbi:MAG: hypothetical protein AAF799_12475 [Myxococcota bacterium]
MTVDVAAWILIALVAGLLIVHRNLVRALWFRTEDPRPVALFRIATGALVLAWLVDLAPLYDYLFTPQGLVDGPEAHRRWGRMGPVSPLYVRDDSAFVHAYLGALGISAAALMVGFCTPVSAWLTWGLFVGLLGRNGVFTGGEQIFTCFLFYLSLSRCGHAFSVDAWLHRRRGGQPRTIPAWPRNLMLLQMLGVLCANGFAKYGRSWQQGDTLHFVLNHPHFRAFEAYGISALLGTTALRWMTWITHAFEILFFLVLVGVVVKLVRSHPVEPPRGRARWLGRALGVAIGMDIVVLANLRLTDSARASMSWSFAIALGVVIALGPVVLRVARRLPPVVLRWALGRRVWVSLWLLFTAQLVFVLRIGWFTALTMCAAVLMFEGEELARALARIGIPFGSTPTEVPRPPRPWRRRFIGALCAFHVVAAVALCLPAERPVSPWRKDLERPLRRWIRQTNYAQVWRMFAPSGSIRVLDFEAVMRDDSGQVLPLGAGIVAPEHLASRWGLDKREKIRRRLGSPKIGPNYWPAHARWVCRQFGARVDGPSVVELYRTLTPIPTPRALQTLGVEQAVAQAEASRERILVFSETCSPN